MDNRVTCGFGGVIDLICCVSLLVYRGTLELSGAPVVVAFAVLHRALCNFNLLSHLFASVAIAQIFNCSGAVCYCGHYFVSMCDGGLGELLVVEVYSVCETFAVGVFYVSSMCAVVFW